MNKVWGRKMLGMLMAAFLIAGMTGCGSSTPSAYIDAAEEQPEEPMDASVYVEPIADLDPDFLCGVDVSSYASLRDSGVKFYDYDGEELDEQGFFQLLADCGMNYVRVRVWNDPTDSEGHSYGGGNNDLNTAVKIGTWASQAGMKVMVDFHYSDFWADPGKQSAPKEWKRYTVTQKEKAVEEFTATSLQTLLDAGVDVGMVQVGNETNGWVCGEKDWECICRILSAGSRAVRNVAKENGRDIQVALHFANPETEGRYADYAACLAQYQVDYDVFASSYYPYWHGTLENLKSLLSEIAETYDKKVMVAETSWAYTYEDGDGLMNTIYEGKAGIKLNYAVSEQGQADELRDVIAAVAGIPGGIGVCYWEPAWIPVQVYDETAKDAEQIRKENQEIWETKGSGWATSYAGSYDKDAGEWYGGSAVDNQALFDFTGHPLDTLRIFQFVRTGTTAPKPVATESPVEETAVANAMDSIDNLLQNPGFEEEDMSCWSITDTGEAVSRDKDANNVKSGDYCLHFWDDQPVEYTVEQTIILDQGNYVFGGYLEGGDAGDAAEIKIYVKLPEQTLETETKVTSWQNWENPEVKDIQITEDGTEVTVGFCARTAANGWGAWDDMYLYAAE